MAQKVTITIPEDLSKRFNAVKETFNVSGVCKDAIRQEVSLREILSEAKNKKMNPTAHKFKLTKEQKEIYDGIRNEKYKNLYIQQARKRWKWEHSLDNVCCELGGAMCVTSDDLRAIIAEVLLRVPDDVREFVCWNCYFTSIECRAVFRDHSGKKDIGLSYWHIFLDEDYVDKDDCQNIIAQLIADAYLGHNKENGFMPPTVEEALKYERESCELVKKWGFVGSDSKVNKQIVRRKKQVKRKKATKKSNVNEKHPGRKEQDKCKRITTKSKRKTLKKK